ncbi:hypothetical protein [Paracoccus sediminicola]|uniref:hypothetical protein n=1 Tax=Paracoccus sediminicola TaxID=3017783 RepID=UPI0022F0F15C|nr:hypothetical protein [Paracoccus sediminicola]WBU57812.1 hypothetical protein PAF18_05125 [Paracoccus sediminicola]
MSHPALRIVGLPVIGIVLLSGCADSSVDYPALLPTDQLLAPPSIPGHAEIAATSPDQVVSDLESAGAALAVSSAEVTAADPVDAPALDSRAEALRRRAEALRQRDAECGDLPDDPDC